MADEVDPLKPISEEVVHDLIEREQNTLESSLEEYHRACEEEFTVDSPEGAAELRKRVTLLVPDAEEAISQILKNGSSDSTRLSAAKLVLNIAFGKALDDPAVDPMATLLSELSKNDQQ